jgi:hypothetical protein
MVILSGMAFVAGGADIMRRTALLLVVGVASAGASSTAACAQAAPIVGPASSEPYGDWLTEAASRFALPVSWIRAILRAESAGKPQATSPKGAMGLMQLMPATWGFLRDALRLGGDPYDAHDNIIAGAAYIRMLIDRYGSPGWIAAYNAGPGRYEASLRGRALPAETRAYTATVAAHLQRDGGSGAISGAAVVPVVWTHAPLFVVPPVRTLTANSVPPEPSADDASTVTRARNIPAIALHSDGLFVAQTATGSAP